MDKQLAQHRTQEQGSRIAAAAHLNYEFAMFSYPATRPGRKRAAQPLNPPALRITAGKATATDCLNCQSLLKWQFAMYSLDQLILFGERSLAYVLQEYLAHHQQERNHQGLDNVIPFPDEGLRSNTGAITKSERLGGLLQFYYRKAA